MSIDSLEWREMDIYFTIVKAIWPMETLFWVLTLKFHFICVLIDHYCIVL